VVKAPAYVILGRGRWAKRMEPILAGEGRRVANIENTRQGQPESEDAYISRLADAMKASGAQIAWVCITPGPHVSFMIQAALQAGLHVIVEKPWYGSEEETRRLQSLANARRRLIAVHFEYLVHPEVESWKKTLYPGEQLRFVGHFSLGRADHLGVPAADNLGCHLMAVHEFSVPSSTIVELQCAYERSDERCVWLEREGKRIASIDLLQGSERIIQDFMKRVEAALAGATFPFDLTFALRVASQLQAYGARCSSQTA
jgi:GFO/IDH/MocA oxidoreductase family protein